jgi:hypothetical protein
MSRVSDSALLRRTILLVVTAALLLSQALGLLHRVVHAPQGAHVGAWASAAERHAVVHIARAAHVDEAAARAADCAHWLDKLFASHDADACASYDQLAHADFLWGAPPGLGSAAVTTAVPSSNPAWHLAAQAAGYLARGPPRLD